MLNEDNLNELMAGLDEGDSISIYKSDNDLAKTVGLRMNNDKATIVSLENETDNNKDKTAKLTIIDTMLSDNDYSGKMNKKQLNKYIKQLKEIYRQM